MRLSKYSFTALMFSQSMSIRTCMVLCALGTGALPLPMLAQAPAEPPPSEQPEPSPDVPPVVPPPTGPRPPVADEGFVPSEELAADEEVTFPIDI